ncbi:MAG TPA: tetraacyldisaccharide 4'-kinase [Calidithermus sp.]|nr:tetraacyldisaccharide 4'-kinase [Calidithermus sp.]
MVEGWDAGFGTVGTALLAPAAAGYRGILALRDRLYATGRLRPREVGLPVVSVGNLTVGGSGKTPAVELVVRTLLELGHRPAVLSRGYRRRSRGVQVVADTAAIRLDAEDAGDEPFLLARRLPGVPVVVGADRAAAARVCLERFAVTALVLDDGFQHRSLRKHLEIVMVRARRPWGNGRLLPAGPLREPLAALGRADLIVATATAEEPDLEEVRAAAACHAPTVPVLAARYAPVECWDAARLRRQPPETLAGARLVAFAGLAAPERFRSTLDRLGVQTLDVVAFPDHHWYAPRDLQHLDRHAGRLGAHGLVTTEKDWVRLRRLPLPARPLWIVSVRLELVSSADIWRAALERACPKR